MNCPPGNGHLAKRKNSTIPLKKDRGKSTKISQPPKGGHCKKGQTVVQCIRAVKQERLNTMSHKLFTEEEIAELAKNPYVERVSERIVILTPEFKKIAYDRLMRGEKMADILTKHGFDTAALGGNRIRNQQEKILKKGAEDSSFAPKSSSNKCDEALLRRISQLEHALAYTQQEVEFVKKIQQADMEARKKWESKRRQP